MEKDILDYEQLVKSYEENLNIKLRSFCSEVEFLDMWVPDPDHTTSIVSLVESAHDAKLDTLSVKVTPQTASELRVPELEKTLHDVAQLEVQLKELETVLTFKFTVPELNATPGIYRSKLTQALRDGELTKESCPPLTASLNSYLASATYGGVTLEALINKQSGLIEAAAHHGTTNKLQAIVLNTACRMMPNIPPQEVADHLAIRVEHAFRDHALPRPVAGICSTKNCAAPFQLLVPLGRKLAADYREQSGNSQQVNFFRYKPAKDWVAKSEDEKLSLLRSCAAAAELPFKNGEYSIDRVWDDMKVEVSFIADVPKPARRSGLMALEQALRRGVERTLQIYAAEKRDENQMRL